LKESNIKKLGNTLPSSYRSTDDSNLLSPPHSLSNSFYSNSPTKYSEFPVSSSTSAPFLPYSLSYPTNPFLHTGNILNGSNYSRDLNVERNLFEEISSNPQERVSQLYSSSIIPFSLNSSHNSDYFSTTLGKENLYNNKYNSISSFKEENEKLLDKIEENKREGQKKIQEFQSKLLKLKREAKLKAFYFYAKFIFFYF
jgi:hypothetical protein